MAQDAYAFLFFVILLLAWLLIPLVPAWITYRITPDQKIGLSGPLEKLTIRTGGAFAAYLIVVTVSSKLVMGSGLTIVGSMAAPSVWTFRADVVALDENDKPIDIPDTVQALDVSFKPDLHQLGKSKIMVRLPFNPEQWPFVTVTIPQFGGAEIDLSHRSDVTLDYYNKTVQLSGPLKIHHFRGGGFTPPPAMPLALEQK